MAHQRKLGRPTDQRRAMLRNLTTSLLENGKIETTVTRAKEVQKLADKMVTLGKANTLHLVLLQSVTLYQSCLMKSHLSIQRETAVTPELSRLDPDAVTRLKWLYLSLLTN